jgi:hypothetical protein
VTSSTASPDRLRRLLREPLLHFLVIGVLVFGAWKVRHWDEPSSPTEIRVGAAELRWLHDTWLGQFGHAPNLAEMQTAIRGYVDEEMRYREGLALGLDRDDTIVRRRLAQKYDFTLGAQTAGVNPTEVQLREYFAGNAGRYPAPVLSSFCQVYLGASREALQEAKVRLAALPPARRSDTLAPLGPGDDLPFARCRTRAAAADLARDFGEPFAEVVSARLPLGAWQGPVQSGYGYHLVLVTARTQAGPMRLDAARPLVEADWRREQMEQARAREDQDLRRRYHVTVDRTALTALTQAPP